MNQKLKYALGASALFLSAQVLAQITLYEGEGFSGRKIIANQTIWNFERDGINTGVSSVVVDGGRWEVCENARFEGRCVVLRAGSYDSLRNLGMNNRITSLRPVDERRRGEEPVVPAVQSVLVPAPVPAPQAVAPITFYEGERFHGRRFEADRPIGNFERHGFNDRSSSVVVNQGRWEVCEEARFEGRCVILRRGSYDSLRELGMENRISSARPVDERERYSNERPVPNHEHRERPPEHVTVVIPAPAPAPRFERTTLSVKELFTFDSATLRLPQPKIDRIAAVLGRHPEIESLRISGFTDRLGSDQYNQKLSQRRADAVKAYLVRKGIDANRLSAQGEGEASPVVECTQADRAALIECLEPNRRIEIEQITIERRARQ